MPEETPVDTPIEETLIEETPVEETPVEETPSDQNAIIDIVLTFSGTEAELSLLADLRGYTPEVRRPQAEIDAMVNPSLEDMVMPNPLNRIDWLKQHAREHLTNEVSRTYAAYYKRLADESAQASILAAQAKVAESIK